MSVLVVAGTAIGDQRDVIVVEESVPEGGLRTDLGGHSGEEQRRDARAPQNQVKVGAGEGGVAVLDDDRIAGLG